MSTLSVLTCLGAIAASGASADPTVVRATVYPASSGSVSSPSVSLSTLEHCPQYSGPTYTYLYPGEQPYAPPVGSSWALSNVLSCGLKVPLADVTSVQVYSPRFGFQAPLASADLTDPSQFQAGGALPVISYAQGGEESTYVRPWRGGADQNANDQVIEDGSPVVIVVYENGPALDVVATQHTVSTTNKAVTVRFGATVRTDAGAALHASALTWSWNFGDNRTSTSRMPTHSFVPGVYPVTVQVTDHGTGSGGTDTITVRADSAGGNGNSPNGPDHSNGNHPGGPAGTGSANATATPGQGHTQKSTTGGQQKPQRHSTGQTTPAASGGSTAGGSAPPPVGGSAPPPVPSVKPSTNSTPASTRHTSVPVRKRRTPAIGASPQAPVVDGRLISEVTTLAPSASPLVQVVHTPLATAPSVRPARSASVLPVLAAGLIVVLLLGLGAGSELRGRRDWRALLFGS